MSRQIVLVVRCDRCGTEHRGPYIDGIPDGWDGDVCGQTLCPACLAEFDEWFNGFMRGKENETKQG